MDWRPRHQKGTTEFAAEVHGNVGDISCGNGCDSVTQHCPISCLLYVDTNGGCCLFFRFCTYCRLYLVRSSYSSVLFLKTEVQLSVRIKAHVFARLRGTQGGIFTLENKVGLYVYRGGVGFSRPHLMSRPPLYSSFSMENTWNIFLRGGSSSEHNLSGSKRMRSTSSSPHPPSFSFGA